MADQTPLTRTFAQYLVDIGKGEEGKSGNYRRNVERVLEGFGDWAAGRVTDDGNTEAGESWDGIPTVGDEPTVRDLSVSVFRAYVRYLRSRGLNNNTIETYHAYVSSWVGWCVTEGLVEQNYARMTGVDSQLPDVSTEPGSQQAWEPEQTDQLLRHLDRTLDDALETWHTARPDTPRPYDPSSDDVQAWVDAWTTVLKAYRDRALASLLCFSGLRVGEIARDSHDDREGRDGLIWERVNLDDGSVRVFRKAQHWDEAPLPEPARTYLENYRDFLDPDPHWPVFPTLNRPTLHETIETAADERAAGLDHEPGELRLVDTGLCSPAADQSTPRLCELRDTLPAIYVCAVTGIGVPPSIGTNGARQIMQRRCSAAGIQLDDDHGYLTPHGGRRGLGEQIVQKRGFAAAARFLDNSEEVVRESYQHVEAAQLAADATEFLEEEYTSVHSLDSDS